MLLNVELGIFFLKKKKKQTTYAYSHIIIVIELMIEFKIEYENIHFKKRSSSMNLDNKLGFRSYQELWIKTSL